MVSRGGRPRFWLCTGPDGTAARRRLRTRLYEQGRVVKAVVAKYRGVHLRGTREEALLLVLSSCSAAARQPGRMLPERLGPAAVYRPRPLWGPSFTSPPAGEVPTLQGCRRTPGHGSWTKPPPGESVGRPQSRRASPSFQSNQVLPLGDC